MALGIEEILEAHNKWLNDEPDGEQADLSRANLRGVNLRGANLSEADLSEADLSEADLSEADLSRANLRGACLSRANLRGANLRGANLGEADLSGACLSRANLSEADLRGANLDYASYPISCKGLRMGIDDRLGVQLLYHAVSNILHSPHTSDQLKSEVSAVVEAANRFHRVVECGRLTPFEKIEG